VHLDASTIFEVFRQQTTCDYASLSPNRYTRIFHDRNRPSFSRVPGTCLGGGLAYQDVAVSSVAVLGLITNAFSMCIGRSLLILRRTRGIYAVDNM
jgi:hypothetical protein